MLKNSRIFDCEGYVKLTNENKDLKVILENTFMLKDVVNKINEMIEYDSSPENLEIFASNRGIALPSNPSPKVNKYYRLLKCYQFEWKSTRTTWDNDLETPNKMIQKMENHIVCILKSKKTSLLNEKLDEKRNLCMNIEILNKKLEEKRASIKNTDIKVKHKLYNGFLKSCYAKIYDSSNTLLYDLLSKNEVIEYKKLIHSDKEKFNSMEFLRGLVVDEHSLESNKRHLTNELNVLLLSIENLSESIQAETEKAQEDEDNEAKEVEVVPLQQVEVPDSWEDL